MKILIVAIQYLQPILTDKYEIQTVESGQEAIDILKEEFQDLVIIDNRLPDQSGLQLLSDIKKMHPQTEVIMVVANLDDEFEALKLGAFGCFQKPIPAPRLRNWVAAIAYRQSTER